MRSAHRLVCNNIKLLPSEEGTFKVLRHFTWKPRPKSGLDCLVLTVLFRGGGTMYMIFKTYALKMAQDKAKIWPWLAYVCRIRSTAAIESKEWW